MKDITATHKFLIHMVIESIKHPRTQIEYTYCTECKIRIAGNTGKCPVCEKKVGNSPDIKHESPIPWWGAVAVILLGVGVCITGATCNLTALDRVGDALVFIPLGRLFGVSRLKD
jgi:hypothetical protein